MFKRLVAVTLLTVLLIGSAVPVQAAPLVVLTPEIIAACEALIPVAAGAVWAGGNEMCKKSFADLDNTRKSEIASNWMAGATTQAALYAWMSATASGTNTKTLTKAQAQALIASAVPTLAKSYEYTSQTSTVPTAFNGVFEGYIQPDLSLWKNLKGAYDAPVQVKVKFWVAYAQSYGQTVPMICCTFNVLNTYTGANTSLPVTCMTTVARNAWGTTKVNTWCTRIESTYQWKQNDYNSVADSVYNGYGTVIDGLRELNLALGYSSGGVDSDTFYKMVCSALTGSYVFNPPIAANPKCMYPAKDMEIPVPSGTLPTSYDTPTTGADSVLDLPYTNTRLKDLTTANPDVYTEAPATTVPTTDVENPAGTANPAIDLSLPSDFPIDFSPLTGALGSLKEVFPFCIPWDIQSMIQQFDAPQAPKVVDIPYFSYQGKTHSLKLDMNPFDKLLALERYIVLMYFIFFLLKHTRRVINS